MSGSNRSGLAFIIELIAGALTGSRVGYSVSGGWGTSYILINPAVFRPINEFKRDVDTAIAELKNSPKAEGIKEIYFPGERSQNVRNKQLNAGFIELSDKLFENLKDISD